MSHIDEIIVKPVEMKIGEKTYLLKYDFNAFIELEDEYGSVDEALKIMAGEEILDKDGKQVPALQEDGITPLLDKDGKQVYRRKLNLKSLRFLVWAGLKNMSKNSISIENVGEFMNFSNMSYISECVMEAIEKSMPKKEEIKIEDDENSSKNS